MFNKLVNFLFGSLIREAVQKELEYMMYCSSPKLDQIKIAYIRSGVKLTAWQALENNPTEICLCITWIDVNGLEDFTTYRVKDVSELRHTLLNIKSKHNYFSHVGLHVQPIGSTKSIIESIVSNAMSDKQYKAEELQKVFIPIIKWIDERPELLV